MVVLIVVGGQKFLPINQHPPPGRPPLMLQRFFWRILPDRAFRALEEGTRHWLIECACGRVGDYWDHAGIRYKAAGQPRQAYFCPDCGRVRWHKVRKKSAGELGGPGNPPDL